MKLLTALLLFLCCLSVSFAAEKEPYQERATDYPDTIKQYPLIHLDLKSGDTKVSYLRFEKVGPRILYRFDPETVPAGKELEIRGYWISKNMIEAYRYQDKKKSGPRYDEILKAF